MSGGKRDIHLGVTLLGLLYSSLSGFGQAKPTATGPGAYVAVGGMFSAYQIDYGKRVLGGGALYVDANLTWRFGVEGEARFLRLREAAETNESTYLIGPRVSLGSRPFDPYVKALVGIGRYNFPNESAYGRYLVVAPGAGLDWKVNKRLSVRVVDFEYQAWPSFTFGAIRPYGVSSGLSIRLF